MPVFPGRKTYCSIPFRAENDSFVQFSGGPAIQGELWLSLFEDSPVALAVLPRLASACALERCTALLQPCPSTSTLELQSSHQKYRH